MSINRNLNSVPYNDTEICEIFQKIQQENSFIELPLFSETINIHDLTLYIKSELKSIEQNVTDSILQMLSKCIYQQLDKQTQIFYLLRLIFHESYFSYLSQRKKKLDLTELNMEETINAYIGKQLEYRYKK